MVPMTYLPMSLSISRSKKREEDAVLCYLPEQEREDARAELIALANAIWEVKIFQRRPPVRISMMGDRYENWREELTVLDLLKKYAGCPEYLAFETTLVSYLNYKWAKRDSLRGGSGGGHDINYNHG